MKKIWIFLGIILILLIVGYLYSQGYIKTSWQWLSAILAGLAGPFEFIRRSLTGENKKTEELLKRQQQRRQRVRQHRERYDAIIRQKEQRIQELEAQVQQLEDQIDRLKLEYQQVDSQVNQMDTQELQEEFIKYYGDE